MPPSERLRAASQEAGVLAGHRELRQRPPPIAI